MTAHYANDRFAPPIVLKNSKIAGFKSLANVACGRIQPLQGSVKSIRAPVGVFAVSEAHQQL
jgi:hypothetical protein